MIRRLPLLLIFVFAACGTSRTPITLDMVPAELGVLPGQPLDEVKARFPAAEVGEGKYNDHLGTVLRDGDAHVEIWFTGTPPRLARMEIGGAERCALVKAKIAPQKGSESCPGNMRTGDHGEMVYCLAGPDGKGVIRVLCAGKSLEYIAE